MVSTWWLVAVILILATWLTFMGVKFRKDPEVGVFVWFLLAFVPGLLIAGIRQVIVLLGP